MESSMLFSVGVAFGLTIIFVLLIRPIAIKIGLVDIPGGRKAHSGHIPLVGGLAMFFGFAFACLTLDTSLQPYRSLLAGGVLLIVVGLVDDFHELSAKMRLLVQLVVSLLMVFWGKIYLSQFGQFLVSGNVHLGWVGIFLTILAVVGLINAKNMLDGIDGLAGSLSFVELGFLGYIAYHSGRIDDAKIIFLLMGAVLAFLFFNFPIFKKKASVFMGDAGSMFLGFVLTWFCVSLSQNYPYAAANPVTFVWIMAVPLLDLVVVFIRRLLKGESPLKADRQHIHHLLERLGFGSKLITLKLCFLAFLMGLIGVTLNHFKVIGAIAIIPFLLIFAGFLFWSSQFLRRNRSNV